IPGGLVEQVDALEPGPQLGVAAPAGRPRRADLREPLHAVLVPAGGQRQPPPPHPAAALPPPPAQQRRLPRPGPAARRQLRQRAGSSVTTNGATRPGNRAGSASRSVTRPSHTTGSSTANQVMTASTPRSRNVASVSRSPTTSRSSSAVSASLRPHHAGSGPEPAPVCQRVPAPGKSQRRSAPAASATT